MSIDEYKHLINHFFTINSEYINRSQIVACGITYVSAKMLDYSNCDYLYYFHIPDNLLIYKTDTECIQVRDSTDNGLLYELNKHFDLRVKHERRRNEIRVIIGS